jgi:hypothetical protein
MRIEERGCGVPSEVAQTPVMSADREGEHIGAVA